LKLARGLTATLPSPHSESMARPSRISLDEPLRRHNSFSDDEDVLEELEGQVHVATIEEKKRLWWKNAAVNSLFIASWCVPTVSISASRTSLNVLLNRRVSL
jgi:hypothetical protein